MPDDFYPDWLWELLDDPVDVEGRAAKRSEIERKKEIYVARLKDAETEKRLLESKKERVVKPGEKRTLDEKRAVRRAAQAEQWLVNREKQYEDEIEKWNVISLRFERIAPSLVLSHHPGSIIKLQCYQILYTNIFEPETLQLSIAVSQILQMLPTITFKNLSTHGHPQTRQNRHRKILRNLRRSTWKTGQRLWTHDHEDGAEE
jgi:hypothetical protein